MLTACVGVWRMLRTLEAALRPADSGTSARPSAASELRTQLAALVHSQQTQLAALDGFSGARSPRTAVGSARQLLASLAGEASRTAPSVLDTSALPSPAAVARDMGAALGQQVQALRDGQQQQAEVSARLQNLLPSRINRALGGGYAEGVSDEEQAQTTQMVVDELMDVVSSNNRVSNLILSALRDEQQQQRSGAATPRGSPRKASNGATGSFEDRLEHMKHKCASARNASSDALNNALATIEACEAAIATLAEENHALSAQLKRRARTEGLDHDATSQRADAAEIAQLRRERDELRHAAESRVEEDREARKDLEDAYEALRAAKNAQEDLTRSVATHRHKAAELEAQLGSTQRQLSAALEREVDLKERLFRATPTPTTSPVDNAVLFDLRADLEAARARLAQAAEDAGFLRVTNQELKDQVAALADALAAAQKEAAAARGQLDAHRRLQELDAASVVQRSAPASAGPSLIAQQVLNTARSERLPSRPLPDQLLAQGAGPAARPGVSSPWRTPDKQVVHKDDARPAAAQPQNAGSARTQVAAGAPAPRGSGRTSSQAEAVLSNAKVLMAEIAATRKVRDEQHRDAIGRLEHRQAEVRAALQTAPVLAVPQRVGAVNGLTPSMERELAAATAQPLPARLPVAGLSAAPAGGIDTPRSASAVTEVAEDLRAQLVTLDREEAALHEQQHAILQKRAAVSSTLMAQRNQKLMNGAPDSDVEQLNNQISAVMAKIDAATTHVEANMRRLHAKRDLIARQLRNAERH
jgi:hypothetical protein